ncbi:MAG: glycosyltransferase [Lentisphaeria bacterium]|nr:glycosyltransferase [Lentisphaeria bacterium]
MSTIEKTVSVIVPIYNTESFLPKCLDSLCSQTLHNIELILVDDGSTDASGKMCDAYLKKYSFVKVIHQENSGVRNALRTGMQYISGEYFSFCGSDDFVTPDFYENLYNAAKQVDADIAQCGYSLYYGDENIVEYPDVLTGNAIKRVEGDCSKIMDVLLLSPPLTVRRIHRTALARKYDINFDETIKMAEDLLFSAEILMIAKKIVHVNQCGYYYRQLRVGRQTLVGDYRLLDFFLIFDKLLDFIKNNAISQEKSVVLLEVNTLTYQVLRLNDDIKQCYCDQFLNRISFRKIFTYISASFRYCWKVRSLKNFLLDALCYPLLVLAVFFCNIPVIAVPLLDFIAFMRKGGFFLRLKRRLQ